MCVFQCFFPSFSWRQRRRRLVEREREGLSQATKQSENVALISHGPPISNALELFCSLSLGPRSRGGPEKLYCKRKKGRERERETRGGAREENRSRAFRAKSPSATVFSSSSSTLTLTLRPLSLFPLFLPFLSSPLGSPTKHPSSMPPTLSPSPRSKSARPHCERPASSERSTTTTSSRSGAAFPTLPADCTSCLNTSTAVYSTTWRPLAPLGSGIQGLVPCCGSWLEGLRICTRGAWSTGTSSPKTFWFPRPVPW